MPDVALLMGWRRDELELLMAREAPAPEPAKRRRAKSAADVRA